DAFFIGRPVSLYVYQDADGDGNPSNALLIGGPYNVLVGMTETFQTYSLNNLVAPGPGDLYLGFEDTYAESGNYTPRLFPAAEDTTTTQVRSWVVGMGNGTPPDKANLANNDVIGTIDSFGLPGNWMIRANG